MNNQNQISPHEAAYQLELIKNPKYDSDWIGEAAKILSNEKNTFGEEDLAKFNALQLMVMNLHQVFFLWLLHLYSSSYWIWRTLQISLVVILKYIMNVSMNYFLLQKINFR